MNGVLRRTYEQQRVLSGQAEHCKQVNVFNTQISLLNYTGEDDIEFAIFYKVEKDSTGTLKVIDTSEATKVTHKKRGHFCNRWEHS